MRRAGRTGRLHPRRGPVPGRPPQRHRETAPVRARGLRSPPRPHRPARRLRRGRRAAPRGRRGRDRSDPGGRPRSRRVLGDRRVRRGGGDGQDPRLLVLPGRRTRRGEPCRRAAGGDLVRGRPGRPLGAPGRRALPGCGDGERRRLAGLVRCRGRSAATGAVGPRGVRLPGARVVDAGISAHAVGAVPRPAFDQRARGRRDHREDLGRARGARRRLGGARSRLAEPVERRPARDDGRRR